MHDGKRVDRMDTNKLLSKKIGYSIFGIIGFVCAFLWKAEHDLAIQGNVLWTGNYILGILAFSLFVGVTVGVLICLVAYGVAERKWTIVSNRERTSAEDEAEQSTRMSDRKVFLLSFLLIVFFWLPCYLAYYPGICSYDTTIQLEQIVKEAFNDHHPIAHTLLIKGAMIFGENVFGSVNTGVGILVAVQMILLAGAFAYGVKALHHLQMKKVWTVLLLLYCMIYPFHWYMSVTTIKDTWFSAFFLLQIVSLCMLLRQGEKLPWCNRYAVLFTIATTGMILFRNNGRYAMLVLLVFLLLAVWRGRKGRRLWTKLLVYSLAGVVLGSVMVSCLFKLTNAQPGDKREMLSVPIQQMARCMVYHGGAGVMEEDDNTMREEDKAFINDFFMNEGYKKYRPDISDPVKKQTNTSVALYRVKEFVSTYVGLFAEYPGDYINAVLATNAGYLYPGDKTHAVINLNGRDKGLGYIQTRWVENELNPSGIYKASKWEWMHKLLEKWADENAYLNISVLKYLFVPGTYFWLSLLLTGVLMLYKKFRMLFPMALVWGYYATLFLGPTVQLRYIYPIMIVLPFVAVLAFVKMNVNALEE